MQKSIVFLYPSNEEAEIWIIETKLFKIASQNEIFRDKHD
jgi:hypothetical protein